MKISSARTFSVHSGSDELERAKQHLEAAKNLFNVRKFSKGGDDADAEKQTEFDEEIISLFERGLNEAKSPDIVWRCHDTVVQLVALTLEPAQLMACIDHFVIMIKSGRLIDAPNEICKLLTDQFEAVRTNIDANCKGCRTPTEEELDSWREAVSGLIGSCYHFSQLRVDRRRAQGKALIWAAKIAGIALLAWSLVGNVLLLDSNIDIASLNWTSWFWGPGVWVGIAGLAGGVTAQGSSLIKEKPYLTSLANARSIHILNITLGGILAIAVLYLVKSGILFPSIFDKVPGGAGGGPNVAMALGFVAGLLPSSVSRLIENSIK